ncbi:MAG: efflux RND transporter periplasmic adaptor subunit [Rhodospirillales bacterium]|nr:efflux RND transporter periplasmic adaptor subunit [Rhodospirillales bacterium]
MSLLTVIARFPLAHPRVLAVLALAILAAGGWYAFARPGSSEASFLTAKVQKGDIEDTTTALGTLQPVNYVDVGTQVSGQLRRVHVEIGQTVKEGQLLAEIDPIIYGTRVDAGRAQLQSLRAQLSEKQAQLALAEEQFERQSRMIRANATSQDAFQSAQTALKTAQAQVAQLRAQIQQIESNLKGDEANLGYTKVYAPMTGTVVTQIARQGQTINATQQAPTIVRIADLATMTVWTQVSEADVTKLKVGQEVYFTTLGQPERRRSSRLRQILPTPDVLNNVVLYNALFDIANQEGDLGIQMSAQVFFVHAAAQDALLVPIAALAQAEAGQDRAAGKRREGGPPDRGRGTVLVVKDGKPEARPVTVGVRNRVQAQILSGLAEGDEVVIGRRLPEAKRAGPPSGPPGGGVAPPASGQQPARPRP